MSDEQMIELRKEMDYKLSIIDRAREEDRNSIIQFHKDFGQFRIDLAKHFERDIARDEKIADLVKVIKTDNGNACVLTRVRKLEERNTLSDGIVSTKWSITAKVLLILSMAPGLIFTVLQIFKVAGWIK